MKQTRRPFRAYRWKILTKQALALMLAILLVVTLVPAAYAEEKLPEETLLEETLPEETGTPPPTGSDVSVSDTGSSGDTGTGAQDLDSAVETTPVAPLPPVDIAPVPHVLDQGTQNDRVSSEAVIPYTVLSFAELTTNENTLEITAGTLAEDLTLPTSLKASVVTEGGTVDEALEVIIPSVTWESVDYDATRAGTYTFSALLPDEVEAEDIFLDTGDGLYSSTLSDEGIEGMLSFDVKDTALPEVSVIVEEEAIFSPMAAEEEPVVEDWNELIAAIYNAPAVGPTTITVTGNVVVPSGAQTLDGGTKNITLLRGCIGDLITVGSNTELTISNITIDGQKSAFSNNTGSLVEVNGGTLTLGDGAVLTNNRADNGGGVYVGYGSFTMSGGTISGNTASGGGGVYVYGLGTFTMQDGMITGNTATNGGGVYAYNSGTFRMSGGTISGNTSSGGGGGVCVFGFGTFTMQGGIITDNTTTNGGGGGVRVISGAFTMSVGTISNNSAAYGGGVLIASSYFTMQGGTISGNTARSGGGVDVGNTGSLTITGGTISRNEATYGGGVRVAYGSFTMSSGTISGNEASNGGGVFVDSGSLMMSGGTISSNTATTTGAEVYLSPAGTLTLSGAPIIGSPLGGVYRMENQEGIPAIMQVSDALNLGAYIAVEPSPNDAVSPTPTIVASKGTADFSETEAGYFNYLGVAKIVRGADDNTTLVLGSETLQQRVNRATGGTSERPVPIILTTNITLDVPLQIMNTAAAPGEERHVRIISNSSSDIQSILRECNGNLITVPGGSSLVFENVSVNGQKDIYSANTGSLVYVDGGTFTLGNGAVLKNNTAELGGGVYVDSGPFTMSGGTITGNTAAESGGGVRIWGLGSSLTMSGGTITGNTATDGGGVNVGSEASLTMSAGTISDNTATYGGGVYADSGSFTMEGGTVSDNTTFNGGGVYVFENSSFTMEGGTVSGNTASNSGGGVCVFSLSSFTMEDGAILGNTALNGGGVYVASSPFAMSGGTISGNTATESGGGVFVDSGSFLMRSTTMPDGSISSATISNNTATENGRGVFLSSSAVCSLSGTPVFDGGNGLYIADEASAPLVASDFASTPGSILIEGVPYLSTTDEDNKVIVAKAVSSELTDNDLAAFTVPNGYALRLSDDQTQILYGYARYSITYHLEAGLGNPNPVSYTLITPDISLKAPVGTPASSLVFDGWYDAQTGGAKVTSVPVNSTGDVELWAQWTDAPTPTPASPAKPSPQMAGTGDNAPFMVIVALGILGGVALSVSVYLRRRNVLRK